MAESRIPMPVWDDQALFESRSFELHVGQLYADEIPHYLIINKETGVVEYAAENMVFAREWISHVQPKMDEIDGLITDETKTITKALAN